MSSLLVLIVMIVIYPIQTHFIINKSSLQVSPNWLGSFYTRAECDTEKCCCIYGLLKLSKMSPNYLRFVGLHEGVNCPENRNIDVLSTMPTGFVTSITISDTLIDMELSADSSLLRFYNPLFPSCNGSAVRNHSNSKQIPIIFLMVICFKQLTLLTR